MLDNNTIRAVLDKYGDMMYFLALHYVRNKQDAEDVVQDVLLSYIKRGGVTSSDVKPWLIRVTVNKSLDLIKKYKRWVSYDDIDETAATVENKSALFDRLQPLGPLDREIVFLHYYAGYATKEIAKIVHKSDTSVRKRLERSRSKLKDFLE